MATGPMIGINLDSNSTIPVEIFHHGVLSPSPSNPDPLLAEEEVNSYSISLNPWNPGLFNVFVQIPANKPSKQFLQELKTDGTRQRS
jgi:hypothetical protein